MSDFIYVAGENDEDARARAFYLLKKYTSATLLRAALDWYRTFVREFEREIQRLKIAAGYNFSYDLTRFSEFLQLMESAEPLLTHLARRVEVVRLLRAGLRFHDFIWGRRAIELGYADPDHPFYQLGWRASPEDATALFAKAHHAADLFSLFFRSLNKQGKVWMENPLKVRNARGMMCWTYESIFFDTLPFNGIPPIDFPVRLDACPPRNTRDKNGVWAWLRLGAGREVRSGKKIPVTGIWEPWSRDPAAGVRCPNYYLAGDIASQYQFEGADTLEDVCWRLIWKDTRYEDGNIPLEEAGYFNLAAYKRMY